MSLLHSRRFVIVTVLVVTMATGCLGAPIDGEGRTVSYSVSNDATDPILVTLSVTDDVDGFAVTDANGSTERYPGASSFADLPQTTTENAVRIVPLGDDVQTFSHRIPADAGIGNTVEGVPRGVAIVYTIASPTRAESSLRFGLTTCGPATTASTLDIRLYPDGNLDTATTCRG